MKKVLFTLLLMALSSINTCLYAEPTDIPLELGYVDPTLDQDNPQRSPVMIPHVAIDEYTLTFYTPCDGCMLRLFDEDGNLVYAIVIPDGTTTLSLPSYLSGDYEIQIIRGSFKFYGYINIFKL